MPIPSPDPLPPPGPKPAATPEQIKEAAHAWMEFLAMLAQIIKRSGSIPSGHLYAELMGHIPLDIYYRAVADLKRANLIREFSHLLIWIGSGPPVTAPIVREVPGL